MVETKYKINDALYFSRKAIVGKCVVEELMLNITTEETIVNYVVRPYGLNQCIKLPEAQLFATLDDAKDDAKKAVEDAYQKNIKRISDTNEEKIREMEEAIQKVKQDLKEGKNKPTQGVG